MNFSLLFGFVYVLAILAFALVALGLGLYQRNENTPLLLIVGALLGWGGIAQALPLLRWIRAVPGSKLFVSETGFGVRTHHFRFDDLDHIRTYYSVTHKRQNLMEAGEDHNVVVELKVANGQRYEICAGQGPSSWFGPSLGKSAAQELLSKVVFIQQRTFGRRLARLVSALDERGYFYFDSKRIDNQGNVHFPDDIVPLSSFSFATGPFELVTRAAKWLGRPRRIDVSEDRDVFLALVNQRFGLRWSAA